MTTGLYLGRPAVVRIVANEPGIVIALKKRN